MTCIEELIGDIPKSCSQKRLRGYTGIIKLYDYRGYTLAQSQFSQSVTLEADPYSIIPLGQPIVRDDNLTVYTHFCEFTLQNEDPEVIKTLSDFTQIPIVLRCELTSGEWIECFSLTGGKLLLNNSLAQGVGSNKNSISFQHFDRTSLEPYPPMEKALTVNYIQPIVSLGISPSEVSETGANIPLTLTPSFTQNDAGEITQVIFKKDGIEIHTQVDLTPYIYNIQAITGTNLISVEISYSDGLIKEDELGNPSPGQILAGTKTASKSFTGNLRKWFGPYGTTPPLEGEDIRTLGFTYDETFTLNTGITSLYQVIAIPTTRELVSVIDLDSASLNITSAYLLSSGILQVPDGSGVLVDYNVYICQTVVPYNFSHRHLVSIVEVTPPVDESILNIEDDFEGEVKWSPDIISGGTGVLPSATYVETLVSKFTEVSNPTKITVEFDYFLPDITQGRIVFITLSSDVVGAQNFFHFYPVWTGTLRLLVEHTAYTQVSSIDNVWRNARIEVDIIQKNIKVFLDNVKEFDEQISSDLISEAYTNLSKVQLYDTNPASGNFLIDNLSVKSYN